MRSNGSGGSSKRLTYMSSASRPSLTRPPGKPFEQGFGERTSPTSTPCRTGRDFTFVSPRRKTTSPTSSSVNPSPACSSWSASPAAGAAGISNTSHRDTFSGSPHSNGIPQNSCCEAGKAENSFAFPSVRGIGSGRNGISSSTVTGPTETTAPAGKPPKLSDGSRIRPFQSSVERQFQITSRHSGDRSTVTFGGFPSGLQLPPA